MKYKATAEFWLRRERVEEGAVVEMSDAEVRYLRHAVEPVVEPAPAPEPVVEVPEAHEEPAADADEHGDKPRRRRSRDHGAS